MRFEKGLYTDNFERVQPGGTYRDMQNGVFDLGHQSIRNEQGTNRLTLIPYTPIGSIILSDGTAVIFSTDFAFSQGSVYLDDDLIGTVTEASANKTDTIVINGTDVGKTDVTVNVAILGGDTLAQQAGKWVTALMADALFTAEYKAILNPADSTNRTVLIRTTNGTTAPAGYNDISISVSDTLTEGVWVTTIFTGGSNTIRNSAVGSFSGAGYVAIFDDNGFVAANKMDFVAGSIVEGTTRVNAELDTLIYWTDDNNVPRFANITNPPVGEFDVHLLDLFPYTDSIAFFTLDSISAGGVLLSGAHYIAAAYVDEDGTRSNYFLVSPPIFVNDDTDTTSPDTFDGAPVDTPTNKSITFTLTGLDENHTYVRLAAIKDAAVSLIPDIVIPTGGDLTYTYTGTETLVEGNLADITVNRIAYDKARTMRQLDNRLYMGNLKGRTDIGYQRYANNIKLTGVSKTISGQNALNFKDGKVAVESRSFRRDEVYAFYITWVLTDGGETKAYHIPGRRTVGGLTATGSITFADAPSSFTQSAGTITYDSVVETLIKPFTYSVTVKGTDTTKTDVLVNVGLPQGVDNLELAGLIAQGLNLDATFAAEYIATPAAGVITIRTIPSVTDPAAYNTITIEWTDAGGLGPAVSGTTNFAGGVDAATDSFGAGVICELDGAAIATTANISGQETGTSIATKMATAITAAGGVWTNYVVERIGASLNFVATAGGAANNRTLSFSANGILTAAGAPTASLAILYKKILTVTGASGTLGIDITQGVTTTPYDEAFATSADVTASNWVTTHQAALLALSDPIYCEDTGTAEITLTSLLNFSAADGGATMTFTEVASSFPVNGMVGGGAYFDGNENAAVSGADAQVADLTLQDVNFANSKLFHFSGIPDGTYNMGYWENANEIYQSGADWKVYDVDSNGVGFDTGVTNEAGAVRHHRFPDAGAERFFQGTGVSDDYSVLGVQLSDIKIPTALQDKVKGFKIYYAERTDLNKTVLEQGLTLYGAFNASQQVTQNFAIDPAVANLYDRNVFSCHPMKALTEDTNVGSLSFIKAAAKITGSLTSGRIGITAYADPNGDATMGLHTDGEPLVREIVGKGYIPANTDVVSISNQGFTESLYRNTGGESKLLIEVDNVLPDFVAGAGTSLYNYLFNLCLFKLDVYLSFTLQNLVWTGYWQQDVAALATGPSGRQHAANATPEIYGGDTFIGFLNYKAHKEHYETIATAAGGTGTLSITIDDGDGPVAYTQVFATNFTVTATNWVATHTAALAALTNAIAATDGGSGAIKLSATLPILVTDTSTGGMSAVLAPGALVSDVITHDIVGESDYNHGYRHEGSNPWEKYYPKSTRASVITPSSYPDGISDDEDVDNFWGYNPAYSALANVKFPVPFDGTLISDELPTRVIRSAEDTGGVDDTFREFLPIDFIDLPRNRGELVKLQSMGQILIPHMERGLLRTRGREELDTSGVKAFIGSGDIFSVSPDEIISTDIGYGGLQDQNASLVTEHGYLFVDRAAGKVFMLTDRLEEISAAGMQKYFEDNLDGGGILYIGWDPELRRILITKSGSSTTDFSLSYYPETKSWCSFHDYKPIFYLTALDKLYSYSLAYMHAHSAGVFGKFYETVQEFEMTFIENHPLDVAKQVAALLFDTTAMNGSTEIRKDSFDKVQVTNSYQDTGLVTLVDFPAIGWNVRRTKRTHKVNQLRDILNIAPGSTSQFPSWALKKRLVDNYLKVRLVYSNSDGYLLHVFNAELNLRPAKR